MATKKISNRFNVEWNFAKKCWDILGEYPHGPFPEVPEFSTWEVEEMGGKAPKLVKRELISPQKVTRNGRTLFGD